jgi:hypothetical protein
MEAPTLFEGIILVLLIVLPVGDTIATAFFFSLFLNSKRTPAPKPGSKATANRPRLWGGPKLLAGRSWLLGLMTVSWGLITVVFILIGYLAARRLLGQAPLPQGAAITAIGVVALGLIPIAFAIAFWLTRRKGGGPPPFSETD